MRLGFVGLGRMGRGMVIRLLSKGFKVVAYDRVPEVVEEVESNGAEGVPSLKELARKLSEPRIVWVMVPAGRPVDEVINGLLPYLGKNDIFIDGGNSYYKDSIRRAEKLKEKGIRYLDVGTSGGLEGVTQGLSLMIGGEKDAFSRVKPIFEALAANEGYGYFGSSGAGHFVKMVHNGVEYAILQAYGEGFDLLNLGSYDLDLRQVVHVWNRGSVVRSWLLELAERVFERDPKLEGITDEVGGGQTGMWSIEAAIEHEIPFPMMSAALSARFRSRQEESFATKLVAAIRREFGGHEVKIKGKPPAN
jgi:6-phosphogluconate dehydrogenase